MRKLNGNRTLPKRPRKRRRKKTTTKSTTTKRGKKMSQKRSMTESGWEGEWYSECRIKDCYIASDLISIISWISLSNSSPNKMHQYSFFSTWDFASVAQVQCDHSSCDKPPVDAKEKNSVLVWGPCTRTQPLFWGQREVCHNPNGHPVYEGK